MSDHNPKIILTDMLEAIDAIMDYTKELSYDDYLHDRKTRDAIYRNIMVLGEAANRMPHWFTAKNADIAWQKMESTRNALIHGYDKIDDQIIWNIIQRILPGLRIQLMKINEII